MEHRGNRLLSLLSCAAMLCTLAVYPVFGADGHDHDHVEREAAVSTGALEGTETLSLLAEGQEDVQYPNTPDDGHDHVSVATEKFVRKEATCELPALKARVYQCSLCGEEYPIAWYVDKDEPEAALGHDFEDPVTKVGQCGEYQEGYCRRCQKQTASGAPDHSWRGWYTIKAATCLESGLRGNVCNRCGYKTEEVVQPSNDHVWGRWSTVRMANCGKAGLQQRTCKMCGVLEEQEVAVTQNHMWKFLWSETHPTCTEDGARYHTCAVCGVVDTSTVVVLPATGHTVDDDGDCTTAAACTVCGETVIEAREHSFSGDWTYDAVSHWHGCQNEGCTVRSGEEAHTGGSTDDCTKAVDCDVCDGVKAGELQHDFENGESVPYGAVSHISTCANAGCTQTKVVNHFAAPGRGDCTEPVYCVCGKIMEHGQRGHNFGTYIRTDSGHRRMCLNPGCGYAQEAAHTFVNGVCTVCKGTEVGEVRFTDVTAGTWYYDTVKQMVRAGLMEGTAETTFEPYSTATRGTIMTILARLDGVDTNGGSIWYQKGMEWAVAKGVSDGARPGALISREELAVMLWRYAGFEQADGSVLSSRPDGYAVDSWAVDGMAWAVEHGIVTDVGGGRLNPRGTATRAEVATMIGRLMDLLEQQNGQVDG